MIKCHRKMNHDSSETESLLSNDASINQTNQQSNDLNNSFSQQFLDNSVQQTSFLFNRNIRVPNQANSLSMNQVSLSLNINK